MNRLLNIVNTKRAVESTSVTGMFDIKSFISLHLIA